GRPISAVLYTGRRARLVAGGFELKIPLPGAPHMCALKSRPDSRVNPISPPQGQSAFLALPDGPNPLRRRMLAAMGLAASGAATGWPASVLATGANTTAQGGTPAAFTESHSLAA